MGSEVDAVDVVVVGGGPAGLQAALMLGRGVRSVRVLDAGPPRNARATGVMGFVTRDGVSPTEFRAIAKGELARYGIAVQARRVAEITGERGRFEVRCEDGVVVGKRVILAVGMVDAPVSVPGAAALWGHHIFQCPYCHGWEHRGRPWGVLAGSVELLEHASLFMGWTDRMTAFVGDLEVPEELARTVAQRGVRIERRRVEGVQSDGDKLIGVRVEGETIACEALIARPPQSQTALVSGLGLELDQAGFVKVDQRRQTSRPGVFAAGDLCSPMQSAMGAAAAGQMAGVMVNVDLMS